MTEAQPVGGAAAQRPGTAGARSGSTVSFDEATALEPPASGAGAFTARLADGYGTHLGPFGGYLASIALRAATAASTAEWPRPRPVGFHCQFLRVAAVEAVAVSATTVRRSSVAESLRVDVSQAGEPIVACSVLLSRDELTGVDRQPETRPVAPPPSCLPTFDDVFTDIGSLPFAEGRPVIEAQIGSALGLPPAPWGAGALQRHLGPQAPRLRAWVRLVPDPTFDDPALDAARVLMALDWLGSYVATSAFAGRRMVFHSTLDLSVSFHGASPASEWLYCEVESAVAAGGIAHASGRVWAEDGTFLATGMQQMLQRVRF